MPRREDIETVLVIGSGPILIGQACEFDYSGTQACKVLKQEGLRVILVNNNPATIMTDPEFADATYLEPLTPFFVERIIERERPDALLPTMGGQTGLNLAVQLYESGVLDRYGVKLIGANIDAIKRAEDRKLFRAAVEGAGLEMPRGKFVYSVEEGIKFVSEMDFPVIIRPSFTLGGTGGGIARNLEEFKVLLEKGLIESLINEVLIEESIVGWKEYELEVMRDSKDNFVVICSIENFHPMGVHTGDSITVAPAQTLTDKEYQMLRDSARRVICEIGVETGGSNIQFAVHPETGKVYVIEMNPRVSRSSALASKATGFPIAKIAAKLALGYTLDEIPNDITRRTPASFEPSIDYCVVKIPRWDFEKLQGVDDTLGIQMKSVGEVMAIGRTFKEAFQKAVRSLEIERYGFGQDGKDDYKLSRDELRERLKLQKWDNIFLIRYAFKLGFSIDEIYELTKIDKWFLFNLKELVEFEDEIRDGGIDRELLFKAKRMGYSDKQIAFMLGLKEEDVRGIRKKMGVIPVYKSVDTCSAEFESFTPYFYSTYEIENESSPSGRRKVIILGSGPNRIGQGIEFDYCSVHAVFALKEEGYETIMINCNPETVSTDYDTADKLYFEPLTFEDVMNIVELECPDGVILSFGGQTPLKLARELADAGVNILGTSPDDIDIAEDRKKFAILLDSLGIHYPEAGSATSIDEAVEVAERIGYPVLIRPSYVLGGRAMEICYNRDKLIRYMKDAVDVSPEHPILIDRFLEDAFEYDVDAVCDGENILIGGVMEHIEEAGIHSGDSACTIPPVMSSEQIIETLIDYTRRISLALNVRGLINIQFAVRDGIVYVLEANPRASRTVPFISKVTGVPLAKIATKVMVGRKLDELDVLDFDFRDIKHIACKEAVFPFSKFPEVKVYLGPEMRSTGEVMGISYSFGESFAKAQIGAGNPLPVDGTVFVSVNDNDKNEKTLAIVRDFHRLGFKIVATRGTCKFLNDNGIPASMVLKVNEGNPNVVDYIREGKIQFIINTPLGEESRYDEYAIGTAAVRFKVSYVTTLSAASSAVKGIEMIRSGKFTVKSIQEYHGELRNKTKTNI
jgi:carbamoyl-phosphate synthase large subunit